MRESDLIAHFAAAIAAAGLNRPPTIEPDGRLHRFSSSGRPGDAAGYYVLHADGVPAGMFGCWRTGVSQTWRASRGSRLSNAEWQYHRAQVQQLCAQRNADQAQRCAEAAARAQLIWHQSEPCRGHPYLNYKGVGAHDTRVQDAHAAECHGTFGHRSGTGEWISFRGLLLLIPAYAADGTITTVQAIDEDGRKAFLPGGKKSGSWYRFGTAADTLLVCEGYATGASLYEGTGHTVAVAFDAGNLLPVALHLRQRHPDAQIIVAGDVDAGGTGQRKAQSAALAVGGRVALPPLTPDELARGASDWNDYARLYGLEGVSS